MARGGGGLSIWNGGLADVSPVGSFLGQAGSIMNAGRAMAMGFVKEYQHSLGATNLASSRVSSSFSRTLGSADLKNDVIKAKIEKIYKTLEDDLDEAGKSILKRRAALSKAANSAKALGSNSAVLSVASTEEKQLIDALGKGTTKQVKNLNKELFGFGKGLRLAGASVSALKTVVTTGWQTFSFLNGMVNRFGRMQQAITGERAGFGRSISGAGINFGHMMSAIGAGRKAGMSDEAVVGKMVDIQTQLSRARWGEGPIIENLGKWGLTPFDESGKMKSSHQVMIDMSNKLNSLGSEMEKLQFLDMQGIRPEQRKYVETYAADAHRWELYKQNPTAKGILEDAQILGESGMAARIDAATKIEQKRRDIVLQNAVDQGMSAYVTTMLNNPDLWIAPDLTARQQGVATARSEEAMEALTEALKAQTRVIKAEGGTLGQGKLTASASTLTVEQLKALSLTSGWADASKLNFGDQSSVHILKQALDKNLRTDERARSTNHSNSWTRNGILIGGSLLALGAGLAMAPFTGGMSALGAAALIGGAAGVGAGVGGFGGGVIGGVLGKAADKANYLSYTTDDVREAKKAARGSEEDWRAWQEKMGLQNIKRSQVLDVDFDSRALEGAKVQSLIARAMEKTGGKEVNIDAINSDKYLDRMTQGVKPGTKEYEELIVDAIARTADSSIGMGKVATALVTQGVDIEKSPVVKKAIEERTKKILDSDDNITETDAKRRATKEVKDEFYEEAFTKGDVIKSKMASDREDAERKYAEYKEGNLEYQRLNQDVQKAYARTGKGKSFEEWKKEKITEDSAAGRALKRMDVIQKTNPRLEKDEESIQDKDEWMKEKLGTEEEHAERVYQEVKQASAGREIAWNRLPDVLKNKRIAEIRGSKPEEDDDLLVSKIALEAGAKEDDIRSNIISREQYDKYAAKVKAKEKLTDQEKQNMRIYESSSKFKAEKKAEKEKAAKEKTESLEGVNDIETYREAAKMVKGEVKETFAGKSQEALQNYGLSKEQQKTLETLRGIKNKGGKLTENQEEVLADLTKRAKAQSKAKVDRKKLIRLVSAAGGSINQNFTAEEIATFKKEEEEEKQKFLAGAGNTEGQYKLYKEIEGKQLRGEEVSDKQKAFYEGEKKKLAKRKPIKKRKPLHDEYVPTKEEQADIDDALRNGRASVREYRKNRKGRRLAEVSDLRRMSDLRKKGFSDRDLQRSFGKDRFEQLKKAEEDGSIKKLTAGTVFEGKKKKKMTREQYEANMKARLEAVGGYSDEQRKAKLAEAMKDWDEMHPAGKGKGKEGEKNATDVMKDKEKGVAQASEAMAKKGEAASTAAASGNKAAGAAGGTQNISTTVNNQTNVTVTTTSTDPEKQGEIIGDKVSQANADKTVQAVNSNTSSKNTQ